MTSELEKLIDCDRDNAPESVRALRALDSASLEAVDFAVASLEAIGTAFSDASGYDEHQMVLDKWAEDSGLGGEALPLLSAATIVGKPGEDDSAVNAKHSYAQVTNVLARMHLLLRLPRDLLFSLSDLLRLRLIESLGYLRLQSECLGLLLLATKHLEIGEEWFRTGEEGRGKEFYDRWQKKLRQAIKELGFSSDYDVGSNMAFHSRASGLAPGIIIGSRHRKPGEVRLCYQEVNDPYVLFFWFAQILHFHRRAVEAAPQLFPEVSPGGFKGSPFEDFFRLENGIRRRASEIHGKLGGAGMVRRMSGGNL